VEAGTLTALFRGDHSAFGKQSQLNVSPKVVMLRVDSGLRPEGASMCKNCHVVTVAVEVRDLEALDAACKRLGWQFHRGRRTHRWYGRWVDDSPLPRSMFATEDEYLNVCAMDKEARKHFMTALLAAPNHVLTVPGHDYEVGVHNVGDTYQLAFDEWHGGFTEKETHALAQAYAVELTKLQALHQGLPCTEHAQQDGSIELRVHLGEV
jgi:hypothetical protein